MKKPRMPQPKRIRRNPHARALGSSLYQPRVEKGRDEYRRRPKHPKPPKEEDGNGAG